MGSTLAAAARLPARVPASAGASASTSVSGAAVVQLARKYLGYPYTATGNSPSTGFSCIGFVSYVYRSLGIDMPGDLGNAKAFAPSVSFTRLMPGDVLFFQNTVWNGLSHTAIYIGGGKFIHAEWYNRGVVISSFSNDPVDGNYWTAHYLGANRPWTSLSTAGSAATGAPAQSASASGQPAVPTPTNIPSQVPAGTTVVVRVAALNVRSGPSMQATIITTVAKGARLVVLGHQEEWYRVSLAKGVSGWVIDSGIGKPEPHASTGPISGSSGAAATTVGSNGSPSVTQETGLQAQGTVTVMVDALRVHGAPGLSARVVSVVHRGEQLAVLKRVPAWIDIRLSNTKDGWISDRFVRDGDLQRAPSPRRLPHLQPASR